MSQICFMTTNHELVQKAFVGIVKAGAQYFIGLKFRCTFTGNSQGQQFKGYNHTVARTRKWWQKPHSTLNNNYHLAQMYDDTSVTYSTTKDVVKQAGSHLDLPCTDSTNYTPIISSVCPSAPISQRSN